MRKPYPKDITREQFGLISPILESARKTTRPRQHDLYDIFCAVLYVLTEGCRWRSLPHDYPQWEIVYYYFRVWSQPSAGGKSILDRVLEELVLNERVIHGRNSGPSMILVDSKSVKNTFTAEAKGFDGGKKNIRDKNPCGGGYSGAPPLPSCHDRREKRPGRGSGNDCSARA